jgi:AcrR family transcriptional regulator
MLANCAPRLPETVSSMPRPSKTSREAIVAAAVKIIDEGPAEDLSMRAVARKLGLAPNALYYYFRDRKALEAAVAAEGMRRIHAVLKKAAAGPPGLGAVRRMCHSYVRFARAHPSLYAVTMRKHPDVSELVVARRGFREFSQVLFAGAGNPPADSKADFAPWALLHGLVVLEREGLLEDSELPADASRVISALLAGFSKS